MRSPPHPTSWSTRRRAPRSWPARVPGWPGFVRPNLAVSSVCCRRGPSCRSRSSGRSLEPRFLLCTLPRPLQHVDTLMALKLSQCSACSRCRPRVLVVCLSRDVSSFGFGPAPGRADAASVRCATFAASTLAVEGGARSHRAERQMSSRALGMCFVISGTDGRAPPWKDVLKDVSSAAATSCGLADACAPRHPFRARRRAPGVGSTDGLGLRARRTNCSPSRRPQT